MALPRACRKADETTVLISGMKELDGQEFLSPDDLITAEILASVNVEKLKVDLMKMIDRMDVPTGRIDWCLTMYDKLEAHPDDTEVIQDAYEGLYGVPLRT